MQLTDDDLLEIENKVFKAAGSDFKKARRETARLILERAAEELDGTTVNAIKASHPSSYSAGLAAASGLVRALIPDTKQEQE